MPLFEQAPWLLIPLIVVTVEAWSALKSLIRSRMNRRDAVDERGGRLGQ